MDQPKADRPFDRAPHLLAGLLALALTVILVPLCLKIFHVDRRLAYIVASDLLEVKDQGLALQKAAFAQKDLLPIYGSSEFLNESPYCGRAFFARFPSGFALFPVGKAGQESVVVAERLAALGEAIRGKKVVVIVSSTWFLSHHEAADRYAGNFSELQAYRLIFASPLSPSLKQEFAAEMIKFPATLDGHPLLYDAVKRRSGSNRTASGIDFAGRAYASFLTVADDWQTAFALASTAWSESHVFFHGPKRRGSQLDWAQLTADADRFTTEFAAAQARAGVHVPQIFRAKNKSARAASFKAALSNADEWTQLRILLQTLHELGAKPLLLDVPIDASSFSSLGLTPDLRATYYDRLRNEVRPFGFPLVTLQSEESDPSFFQDALGHPSASGWLKMDRVIDQFYHDQLPATVD